MKLLSLLEDKKVNASNALLEMNGIEYIEIAKEILENNEFQRRRVKSSGTVYSLLKRDLINGCLIPPIVLATTKKIESNDLNEKHIVNDILLDATKLIILDGLQRTYLILDIYNSNDKKILNNITLRIELYLNIDEVSILYRMLTLNTGQTPMSIRHQIEILYSYYLDNNLDEIQILKQVDETGKRTINQYNFSDLIEGYNSYIERNELPLDRYSLLEIVKSIENLSKENIQIDLFETFTRSYHNYIKKIQELSGNWQYPDEEEKVPQEYALDGNPFGNEPFKIFNKPQALSGYGSAIGKLVDLDLLDELRDILQLIDKITIDNVEGSFFTILKRLDEIRNESKKIGNSQRLFFHHFFRGLFDKENDSFLNFDKSIEYGYKRYKNQMS